MQTSSVGGSSVTLQTALAVKPPRPAEPPVVMMFYASPSRAMASRISGRETVIEASSFKPIKAHRRGLVTGRAAHRGGMAADAASR
jgi:hypothetical protein